MLTRMHVDNFRCLVNFDLKFDRMNLLLGENGSGKTTVFDVLRRLRGFLGGDMNVDAAFPSVDLTRWQQLGWQQFELEMEIDGDVYVYSLSIEHNLDRRRKRVKREELRMNGRPLFECEGGLAKLYHDDFSPGPSDVPFDCSRSGISLRQPRPNDKLLIRFRREISKLVVVSPCPVFTNSESAEEQSQLAPFAENFASWYRYLSLEHQGNILDLTQQLREVLPGFDSFSLREAGERMMLKVLFRSGSDAKKPTPYNFGELSDGQRQLIVLYTMLYGVKGEGYSLFLDEPDNYVTLREIQPWLTSLQDACGDSISQAVLISHHPEIIDYLAGPANRWFERPDNGPTRVRDEALSPVDGLKMSQTIARGWTE